MAYALSERNSFLRENRPALLLSLAAHLALLLTMALNLDLAPPRPPQPVRLAIEATVVDARAMRQRAADAERAVRQAEERRIEKENARRREAERQRAAEQELAEQRRLREAAEARRRDEAKRQREAEQARQVKAQQERRKAQEQQQRQKAEEQKRAADEQKKAAAEARRKAEAERRDAQSKAELARAMAEEEQLTAAQESGLLDQYVEVIRQKVERNWMRPASAREGINCIVLVKQIPGGEVVEVRVTECNGDAAVIRSIEAAVQRSSPLPPPPDPALFERSLRFEFRPRG